MRTRLLLAAVAALVTPLAAPPAHAVEVQTFTAFGFGNIAPGLPCTGCVFDVYLTVVFSPVDLGGPVSCTFDGTSTEDLASGSGDGSVSCSDGSQGELHYDRTLAVVEVSGVLYRPTCYVVSGVLTFIPTNVLPVTTFAVTGSGTLSKPC